MLLWIHDTRCEAKLISAKFLMLGDDLSVWDFLSSMTFPWLLMIFFKVPWLSMTFPKFYFSRFSRPCGNPAASLAICEWNPLVTDGFPSQRAMKKCRKCFHVMHHHDCSIIFTQTRIPEVYSFRSQYSCGIRTWGRLVTSQLKFCGDKVILQQSCLSGIFL